MTTLEENQPKNRMMGTIASYIKTDNTDQAAISILSYEILLEIAFKLDFNSLSQLCLTNKAFSEICRDDSFWRVKYQQDFDPQAVKNEKDWKHRYWQKVKFPLRSPLILPTCGSYNMVINNKGHLFTFRGGKFTEISFDGQLIINADSSIGVIAAITLSPFNKKANSNNLYIYGSNENSQIAKIRTYQQPITIDLQSYFSSEIQIQPIKVLISDNFLTVSLDNGKIIILGNNQGDPINQIIDIDAVDICKYPIDVCIPKYKYAAVTSKGVIYSWGWEHSGNLGYIYSPIDNANKISIPEPGRQVARGIDFIIVLSRGGNIYTLGDNHAGQLGVGQEIEESETPVKVILPEKISFITAGYQKAMAISVTGRIFAWGFIDSKIDGLNVDPDTVKYPVVLSGRRPILFKPIEIALGRPALYANYGAWSTWILTDDGVINSLKLSGLN